MWGCSPSQPSEAPATEDMESGRSGDLGAGVIEGLVASIRKVKLGQSAGEVFEIMGAPIKVDPMTEGQVWTFGLDSLGNVVSCTFDDEGMVVAVERGEGDVVGEEGIMIKYAGGMTQSSNDFSIGVKMITEYENWNSLERSFLVKLWESDNGSHPDYDEMIKGTQPSMTIEPLEGVRATVPSTKDHFFVMDGGRLMAFKLADEEMSGSFGLNPSGNIRARPDPILPFQTGESSKP